MTFNIPANGLPFSLVIGIKTKKPEQISLIAKDFHKPETYYISRNGDVNGYREFELKFPQSPKLLQLSIFNKNKINYNLDKDDTFDIVKFEPKKVKTYPLWADQDIHNFVKFAQQFSENASILSAGNYKPSIYRSNDGKFCIDYYDKIRNKNTGQYVSTPARVGHSTGIIEVSKADFTRYTVPMRMAILLHEFSHKYMNPKIGKEISDEVSADVNALNIYLSLGYPTIEAQYAFLKVFRGANNQGNRKRYLILDDFIKKFTKGDLENKTIFKNEVARK